MQKNIILLLFLLGFCPNLIQAQILKYNLSTPRFALETHLKYLEEPNYRPHVSAKSLYYDDRFSIEEMEDRAIKLKRIFDGLGIHIDLQKVPKEPNYSDSLSGNRHIYVLDKNYPDIYLEKIGHRWLYSRHTSNLIPELYDQTYPFGTGKLLDRTLGSSQTRYFGLYIWQYVGIVLALFISGLLYIVILYLSQRIIGSILKRFGYEVARKFIDSVSRPFTRLLVVFWLMLASRLLQFPYPLSHYVTATFKVLWPFFAIFVCYRLVDVFHYYFLRIAEKTQTQLDNQLAPLIQKTLKALVIIIALLLIFNNLGFDVTGLVAGLSIGGLAFALAAQDTLKNLFGSLMIFVDHPFQLGDMVVTPDFRGVVEEIGFRSTRIRTLDNSVISVPNSKMADTIIDNLGMRMFRRLQVDLELAIDTPPDLIEVFIVGLRKIIDNHPIAQSDLSLVNLFNINHGAYTIFFNTYYPVPDMAAELKARHEILLEVRKLADFLQIQFAYPTRTKLQIENFATQSNNERSTNTREDYEKRLKDFLEKK